MNFIENIVLENKRVRGLITDFKIETKVIATPDNQ